MVIIALNQHYAAGHYLMPLWVAVDELGEQKLWMRAPWMLLNWLSFHQFETTYYVPSFHVSWMAVFTLDDSGLFSMFPWHMSSRYILWQYQKRLFFFFLSWLLKLQIETYEIKNCMSLNDQNSSSYWTESM